MHPPHLSRVCSAVLVGALFAITATTLSAQARTPLSLQDYYRLASVGSPALSPDGSEVVYVRTFIIEDENRRHSDLWIVSTDENRETHRLTTPGYSATSPTWSPDGSLLAFASGRPVPALSGSERGNIWFLSMDGRAGEAFQIEGVSGYPLFSPDNRWIAYTHPVRPHPEPPPEVDSEFERHLLERFDGRIYDWMGYRFDRRGYLPDPRDPVATPPQEIFLVPREGGEARQVTHMGVNVQGPAWRPDGEALAFTADSHQRDEHTYERSDLWVTDLDGEVTRLTDDEFSYSSPAWSPDGRFIAVRGNEGLDVIIREKRHRGAATDIFLFSADDGTRQNLTTDWDLIPGALVWGPRGRSLFFTAGIGGHQHLFRLDLQTREVRQVTEGDRALSGISFSASSARIAYLAADPVHPGDIFTARPDGSGERQLTAANADLLRALDLQSPDRILYNSEDGTEIEGWVIPPVGYDPDGGPYPMILTIHGGPHGAYGSRFMFEQQLFAAQGYFVLYTNPRASTGYGEEFRWGIWGGWGVIDFPDLMAGVDHVLERYPVDPERLGVTGYSYGGYMTNWVITHTDRFAAAIAGASISNWVSDYGVADIPRTKESEFFGPPWEEESLHLLLRSSPIVHAKGVSTPTLFIHGESDHRVPIEEAEQMYVALKKQSVPARFIRYPDSYHGGWTPWRLVHRYYSELEWWEEYLGS
ncbi:MAG: S9 family peptidase [Gemmatimonadetes bacterium]|nr:S9 family peptidase [Gemmatimonadota bacterium]